MLNAQRAAAKLYEGRASPSAAIKTLLKEECCALLEMAGKLESLQLEGKKAATKVAALRQYVAAQLVGSQVALIELVGKYYPTLPHTAATAPAAVLQPVAAAAANSARAAAAPACC